ncbi:MAG: hypothetical protein AB1894_26495 [Chloroflexota bacterium]
MSTQKSRAFASLAVFAVILAIIVGVMLKRQAIHAENSRPTITPRAGYSEWHATQAARPGENPTQVFSLKQTLAAQATAQAFASTPLPTATRPTGFYRDVDYVRYLEREAYIYEWLWTGKIGGSYTTVYTGYLRNDPSQGVVYVLPENVGSRLKFLSPQKLGAITIIDYKGNLLVLATDQGYTLYFDVSARQFVNYAWVTPMALGEWVAPETAATPLPEPGEVFDGHEIVLRIHNVDKLTWRSDQLSRWSLWGSPAFTIAPDGSYWFFDITQSNLRLIHLSQAGEVLHQFPASPLHYPIDIVASAERVWALGKAEGRKGHLKTILSYDLTGNAHWLLPLPAAYQMISVPPPERIVDWFLTGLSLNENGSLFLERHSGTDYVALQWSGGQVAFGQDAAYEAYGHRYRIRMPKSTAGRWAVWIDEREIALQGDEIYNTEIIGVAPDGSVYLYMGPGGEAHVRHYSLEGALLGMARVPESPRSISSWTDVYFSEMTVGPDGELYVLVSTQDQEVVIVQVGWQAELDRLPTPTPFDYPTPTPMSVIAPAWETPPAGARPEEQARQALISFLYLLSEKQYSKAAAFYGGGMQGFEFLRQEHADFFARMAALEGEPEQFWSSWCSGLLACYPVGNILDVDSLSDTAFVFWVHLVFEDQTIYASNTCCAANPAIKAPVWLFGFTVQWVDGMYKVMNPPPVLE